MTDVALHLDDRSLTKLELREAGRIARDAFFDDDFFRFLVPNDRRRARGLAILHETVFRHLGPRSQLCTVRGESGAIVGVSAWLTTSGYPITLGEQVRSVLGSIRATGRPRAMGQGNAYLFAGAKVHPREPHWYLWVIAVAPAHQRHGVGAMLMEHALARVDEEGVSAYLETQKESNLAYYQRFGFELLATLRPVPDGPPLYAMKRLSRA